MEKNNRPQNDEEKYSLELTPGEKEFVEQVREWLKNSPDYETAVIPKRMDEAMNSINAIVSLIKETDTNCKVKMELDPWCGTTLYCTINCLCAVFDRVDWLIQAITPVTYLDITPKTDFTVDIGLSYTHVKRIVNRIPKKK